MMSREHVEEIRRTIFSIDGELNPFTEDPHQPVENPSIEMDAHFLKELIQNAEDYEYPEGVDPSLEFVITSKDITNTGAPATLLVFNNEKGFLKTDIESICGVGRSTKKGNGFKSVFLITDEPYIFSDGYQIRFTEEPCQQCSISHIVPEWVEKDSHLILSAIESIYGLATPLPTTTLVLPLKPEEVKPIKDQFSRFHPEVLLFFSKIRRLSVREDIADPKHNTVRAISIFSEKNFFTSKSMDADSYTLHLTAADGECGYYMWKQRFPVKKENKVDVRMEVDEWVITLAFPHGERLKRGTKLPGIYSFLPTETVTNFPFIIQADFVTDTVSSRDSILWSNKWNEGILDCVPVAFVNAFTSLVKSVEDAPVSSLLNMFRFLPVKKFYYLRDAIQTKLMNEPIIPCESDTVKKLFCKPIEAGRLDPSFRSILNKAKRQGISFSSNSFCGTYLVASQFDTEEEYDAILDFLKIKHLDCQWYADCIRNSNLVMGVSEDVYIQLLVFIAESWGSWSRSQKIHMKSIPLIKHVGWDGKVGLLTLESSKGKLLAADSKLKPDCISWMINWNTEFRCPDVPWTKKSESSNGNREFQFSIGRDFLPKGTQEAIGSCLKKPVLVKWLKKAERVKFVSIDEYAGFLSYSLKYNGKLVVTYAYFLYTSFMYDFMSSSEVEKLFQKMPILDKHGKVNIRRFTALVPSVAHTSKRPKIIYTWNRKQSIDSGKPNTAPSRSMVVSAKGVILVPAKGSKWVELFGTNLWNQENYVELGEAYTREMSYFDGVIREGVLVSFLEKRGYAFDVPRLSPPNAPIPILSDPLSKKDTFSLLNWIRKLNESWIRLPKRFLSSIKNNSWLKVSLNGSPGHRMPSESFMLDSAIGKFLQDGLLPFSIPLIDENFYGVKIKGYKRALQTIGVRTEDTIACEYIVSHLTSLAASSKLTRDHSLWILKFTEFLRKNHISSGKFLEFVKEEKWIKTRNGYMVPRNCVLFSQERHAAANSQISTDNIPFIDQVYYGEEIHSFQKQLAQLGVYIDFKDGAEFTST